MIETKSTVDENVRCYADEASRYDKERFSDPGGRFLWNRDRQILRRLVAQAAPERMLDVPVGTGRVLKYLSDTEIRVSGVDATLGMVTNAAQGDAPNSHSLQIANAAVLPFQDGHFDCLSSLRFFHLFSKEERVQFAREFSRVVRPGGFLVVSFTNGFYAGGLNWMKQKAGFNTVHFEYPGELAKLFPQWSVLRLEGNFLPKQWWMDSIPGIGPLLQRLTQIAPLNRVCWERYYLLQKPEDA